MKKNTAQAQKIVYLLQEKNVNLVVNTAILDALRTKDLIN